MPETENVIGRVIIARGDVPWDVKPPIWDDLMPPCCLEPTPEPTPESTPEPTSEP